MKTMKKGKKQRKKKSVARIEIKSALGDPKAEAEASCKDASIGTRESRLIRSERGALSSRAQSTLGYTVAR